MIGRVLSLDFGEKRVGVALSDPLGLTAQAKPYIPNTTKLYQDIVAFCDTYDVQTIVIGLPKNRHGEATQQTEKVKAFAETLQTHVTCPIVFWNEAYSTQAVTRHLIAGDVSRQKRKELVDSQSAAFILQGYLDKHA